MMLPRRHLLLRAVLLTLTSLPLVNVAQADLPGWHADFEQARREAQATNRPILLHFYTDWCFPCKRMEKDVLGRPTVTQVLSSKLILVKLNAEVETDLAKRFDITQFPSDVIVDADGQRILTSTGYQEADKYVSFALAAVQEHQGSVSVDEQLKDKPAQQMIALDGYSPVKLSTDRKWEKGDASYAVEHRGQIYYLTSVEEQALFEEHPQTYVPRLLGCDAVVLRDTDLAVPGSIRFGAFYDDELYLFSSLENRTTFKADPERYTRTRVVRNISEIDRTVLR